MPQLGGGLLKMGISGATQSPIVSPLLSLPSPSVLTKDRHRQVTEDWCE